MRVIFNNRICISLLCLLFVFSNGINAGNDIIEDDFQDNLKKIEESVADVLTSVASKKQENIASAPGVISIVTQDELRRFGGTTLGDILKRVPSLLGTTIYMTDRSVIASRGDQVLPSSSHILLLINGRPVREVLEGGIKSEIYESFPVSVIERIEVIRGPGSVLYGSQAVSAVINVITKKPENNTISVSGVLGERLHNYIMSDLQYKIGDFGVVLGGRYADKGKWDTDWKAPGLSTIYTNKISIPDYGPGMYGELRYRDFRIMCSYNQWENQEFVTDGQIYRDMPEMGITDVTGNATWKKLFVDAGYTYSPVFWYKTGINGTYTRSWFTTDEFPLTDRDAFEAIIEWTNFFTPVENCNVIIGGVGGFMTGSECDPYNDTTAYNRGVYNEGHRQKNFSGYAQVDYRFTEWLKLIGGVQANKVIIKDSSDNRDEFDADFNPRVGIIVFPLEHISMKTLYSTAYRAPSINELYLDFLSISGKMVKRDDPHWGTWHEYNLKPEKVHTFDAGVTYLDNDVQFGLNGFYTRMKNLIFQDRDSTHYQIPTWDNLGEITIFGLECEGKYYLTKELLFLGSFLYQQSRDEKTGEVNVTPLPNFSVKGGVSYQAPFGLTISLFNTFQQRLEPKYGSELNTTTKHFNMLDIYSTFNLNRIFKLPFIHDFSLILGVDNCLDVELWLPAWGLKAGSTIPYDQGRTVYGGLKVAF